MGLVNKQQSDPLYLFFLNQHLETKLHLLPPRRDTAARGCMLSTRSKCVNTHSFCVTSIFPSSLFIIILQSRSYLMLSNLAELLWWRNTQTKRCLGHMSCFMETNSSQIIPHTDGFKSTEQYAQQCTKLIQGGRAGRQWVLELGDFRENGNTLSLM